MRQFSSQQTTTASPSAVWHVWQDVPNWNQWDTELETSRLDGAFVQGATGMLVPKNAPKSTFTITELTEGVSFTYTVPIPLGTLVVVHLLRAGTQTTFAHEVAFTGPLGGVLGRILGRTYAKALPGVLERIRQIAELHQYRSGR